jgi:iron complex outermembrane receptor protein
VPALSITADYYRIDIADRVVLSENLTQTAVRDFLAANGEPGIGGGRFFTNAIDTRTTGVDVVVNYGLNFGSNGILRLTAGASSNDTKITAQKQVTPPALAALNDALFSRVERGRIERGQPRNNFVFSATHEVSKFTLSARTQRFGQVTTYGTTAANDQTFGAKWITDASVGLALRPTVKFTFGADNLFDVYPDNTIAVNNNNGIFPVPAGSPFGINGRFAYARVNWRF